MGETGEGTRSDEQEIPFEAALARLEALVARLERGDLPLEDALATFEEGVALSRRCSARLEAAERRIEILVGEGGAQGTRPFEEPGDTAE